LADREVPTVISRFCALVVLTLGLGSAQADVSSVATPPTQQWQTIPDESEPNAPPPECDGSLKSGPSPDDPNVDTDPDRPITEKAAGYEDEQSADEPDDACRSETLEHWFEPDGEDAMVLAMRFAARASS
jgi:hypothetical protein